jgi:hypothetical protein
MHMRVRNLRSVEKSLLAMAAITIVWFGFIEERFFPLPGPPIDPLTPLIFCIAVFVLYWLLGLIYILVPHRSSYGTTPRMKSSTPCTVRIARTRGTATGGAANTNPLSVHPPGKRCHRPALLSRPLAKRLVLQSFFSVSKIAIGSQ